MKMSPKRPYLLRAFYEWIVDNNMTPHILVDARSNQVSVPRQFVKDGRIVLNISPTAVNNLMMKNDEISFNARFSGRAFSIWLPIWSVMAIYSRETQDQLSFPPEEYDEELPATLDQAEPPVKPAVSLTAVPTQSSAEAPATETISEEPEDEPEPPKPTKSRPSLRFVK